MILAFLAALGAIVVALVLYPVFTDTGAGASNPSEDASEYLRLEEEKTRLYDNIKDLDFERDAGKVSQGDYEAARNDYLGQVAVVIEKMDTLAPEVTKKRREPGAEPAPASKKKRTDERIRCGSCGKPNPKGSKFCLACGKPFGRTCQSCGENLPPQAKFCNACGEKVSS